MRRASLLLAVLFLAFTVEAWAGAWVLAGRWFISSRYATVSLASVKRLLDAGIITRSTAWVKTFVNRNGKWILLTIGLSQVLQELDSAQQSYTYCYTPVDDPYFRVSASYNSQGVPVIGSVAGGNDMWTARVLGSGCSGSGSIPAYQSYSWDRAANIWRRHVRIPSDGTHRVGNCDIQVVVKIDQCSFPYTNSSTVQAPAPSLDNSLSRRRREVEVQVLPNVSDFIREDVIAQNPELAQLRDEYQRIASDMSIPTVNLSDLADIVLPEITWNIPASESVAGSGSASGSGSGSGSSEGDVSLDYPELDSSLNVPSKRSFPSSLVDALVDAHPILRALYSVRLELGGLEGNCRLQDDMFIIDFCPYEWVFRAMGVVIVFIAYLVPFVGIGRGD